MECIRNLHHCNEDLRTVLGEPLCADKPGGGFTTFEFMAFTTSLYISFPGNAREVFEFYHGVFGGELDVITYGEQLDRGAKFPFDPPRDAVAHGTLTGPFTFGGGDDLQNDSGTLDRGVFGFTIEVESVEEGERLVEKLSSGGGTVTMPFAQAPWGAYFGVVEDKFGVAWNITTGDGR